jgi:hypothetical protein
LDPAPISGLDSPFTKIGAMESIQIGTKFYNIAVNFAGTKYAIYDHSEETWTDAFDF